MNKICSRIPILISLFVFTVLYAAAPDIIWHKTYSFWGDDQAFDVVPSMDRGFVVAGETDGPATSSELWVFKVDSAGDTLWSRHFGSADWDGARAIDLAWDGTYLVGGYIGGYAKGNFAWYKFNDAGERLMSGQNDGGAHDVIYDIHQTAEQEIIMAGTSGPRDSLGQLYLVKVDSEGKIVWRITRGGSIKMAGRSVVEAGDNFVAAGERMSGSADQGDMIAFTCSKDSTETDTKILYDESGWERGFGIARAPNGGFVMAGCAGGPLGSDEDEDVYLVKLDSLMEVVWERRYGLEGTDDRANSVERIFPGGYLVTGTTSSFGEGHDVWVLRTDEDGDTLWTLVWDSGGEEYGHAGYPLDDGFIITGTRHDGAGSSAFLLRLGEEKPGVGESPEQQSSGLAASCRSGSMILNYSLPRSGKVNISLYDPAGRKTLTILDARHAPGTYNLNRDVSFLPAGVYFVRLCAGAHSSTAQVILHP